MSSSVLAKEIAEEIAEILFRTAHLISDKLDSECIALIDQKLSGVRRFVANSLGSKANELYETLKIDNVPEALLGESTRRGEEE